MKKLFISADIEGISSTTKWTDTIPAERDYPRHAQQMTQEVLTACRAAIEMGFEDILVRDGHGPATNIDIFQFPEQVRFVRGWEGHPYEMVQGIDEGVDAAAFIGYHSEAGSDGSPMSHTMTLKTNGVFINDIPASEFMISSWAAAYAGVPTVYLAGDRKLCETSKSRMPWLVTTAVKEGHGDSTLSVSPKKAVAMIEADLKKALAADDYRACMPKLPESFDVKVRYRDHVQARKYSYFPGMTQLDEHTVMFHEEDYFEVLRKMIFVL